MNQDQQSRWRPTRGRFLWTGVVGFGLAFLIIVICGYLFELKWTGLPKRTLWDWLDLLIVPVVLAIGGYLFTRSETRATQAAAEQRAQDDALQAYLDNMSDMLIPSEGQPSLYDEHPPDSLSAVARARTLTVLSRLDADRKARVVQFLYEAGQITKDRPIVDLRGADLSGAHLGGAHLIWAHLSGANLSGANLREANLSGAANKSGAANLSGGADLSGADLSWANLHGADLRAADLSSADLSGARLVVAILSRARLSWANLSGARLSGADLSEANLNGANLIEANLIEANLRGADLSWANLGGANLSWANLSGAKGWTEEQLVAAAESLKRATMPNGQQYEDWLKSTGRGEDGETSGTS